MFRLDFEALARSDYIVNIGENSKTGSRRVWPCYPQYFEEFGLQNIVLAKVNLAQSNAAIDTMQFYLYMINEKT